MLVFDFLKKFFGWADSPARKRSADDDKDIYCPITPKRRKPCSSVGDRAETNLIEIDDSSEDEIELLPAKRQTNDRSKDSKNPGRAKMGCAARRDSTTLNRTHRLREKSQYEELLQRFLPQRVNVDRREVVEVIDLDDLDEPAVARPGRNPRGPTTSRQQQQRKKSGSSPVKRLVIDLNEEDEEKREYDDDDDDDVRIESESRLKKYSSNEVRVNTLRDQLSAKDVIQRDFIPRIAKRYNERVEQRHKEAEELKKMTTVLSKHNRLAREAALEEHLARSMRLYEAVLDETEETEDVELPVLTEAMLRQVKQALIPQPADEILVEKFGLRITRKDMHTLSNSNWLNDEVINFYMNLLITRSGRDNYPRCHAMNTFFYPKLISGGHSSLRRWTRKIDLFQQELIVVPIHLGIHWCMSIVDFRDKSIRYYDSMAGDNHKCLASLRGYLEAESLDKRGKPFDTRDWRLINVKDIPQQMNGSDCGVFSCMFAEYVCANRRITFTQDDMDYFRKKMVYEILNARIL